MAASRAPSVVEEQPQLGKFTSDVFTKGRENKKKIPVTAILNSSTPGSSTPRNPLRLLLPTYVLHWALSACYKILDVLWKVRLSLPWLKWGKPLDEHLVSSLLNLYDIFSDIDTTDIPETDTFQLVFWTLMPKAIASCLWGGYWELGESKNFVKDYTAAWYHHHPKWSIHLFIDNERHQYVPCDDTWDDKHLLTHLISFYNVARLTSGIPFEPMDLRAVRRIDIARLEGGSVVGKRVAVLYLGLSGSEGRPVHWFTNIKNMPDEGQRRIVNLLKRDRVLCPNDSRDRNCLNVIRTYRSSYVSFAVCAPTVLSLIVGIVWTCVAATVFNEGLQMSAQTAFTISSYIVTAGSFLIALIVYLDGRFEASFQDSLAVEDIDPADPAALPPDNADQPVQAADDIDPPDPAASQVVEPDHSAQSSKRTDDGDAANDATLPTAAQENARSRKNSESDAPAKAVEGGSSTTPNPETPAPLPEGLV